MENLVKMVKKKKDLKCWKKHKEGWEHKKDYDRDVLVSFNKYANRSKGGWEVTESHFMYEEDNEERFGHDAFKVFKTKPKAMAFAKVYMKKHDKC